MVVGMEIGILKFVHRVSELLDVLQIGGLLGFHRVDQDLVQQLEMLHALHEEPWGQKTMRFYDPDRHLIEVGEKLEHFVRRLHLEGRTPEQVAEKTSIPLNEVRDWIYR